MDFVSIKKKWNPKDGTYEVYPDFKVTRSSDLMVRGKSFYAVWDEKNAKWSDDEYDVQRLIDEELSEYKKELEKSSGSQVIVKWMSSFSSGSWTSFKNYINRVSDNSKQLDEKLTFLNDRVTKKDYTSKRLPYSLEEGDISAYDELMSTLYSPEERAKLEWAIGSIVAGDSKDIQKFVVLYGDAGAGKSTVLNIIQQLFEGYYTVFEAKALTSSNNTFSTEAFRSNPLVAIQHDGDLSKIEDNTKLNSIVSHEEIVINEKYKSGYPMRPNAFLFMATNKPVKITDAKSGVIRRLIDVKPSGRKLPPRKYQAIVGRIAFELGGIAWHCREVYLTMGKNYYASYVPFEMIFQTDVFFNFMEDRFDVFNEQDGITLKQAYSIYKEYCEEALVEYKMPLYKFRGELKNYFRNFEERAIIDGNRIRSYYSGFMTEKFSQKPLTPEGHQVSLVLDCDTSILDDELMEYPAQYAGVNETPQRSWEENEILLGDLDTRKLHYILPPSNLIVIDFDIKDSDGNKSAELNLAAASKWPPTYAEYSKGGSGIHLHYWYDGDVKELSSLYSEGIEVKTFTGKASLRRKLSKCNNLPIATISSGLPLKEKKVINQKNIENEEHLRALIAKGIRKEVFPNTKPCIDFIFKILDDAYKSGMRYDVRDMRQKVLTFALGSSHNSTYCVGLVNKMQFISEDVAEEERGGPPEDSDEPLIFFDCEVYPNLFIVCWKKAGEGCSVVKMINPTSADIADLFNRKLVGFNNRKYDNHILYGRYIGYTNEELFHLSERIIGKSKNAFFREAYSISYTDVYDFASAVNKKSLKKFEIELGIHHKEVSYPWDQPVDESHWEEIADYCANDVIATEKVFDHLSSDWTARCILADLTHMTRNDTTNQLTCKMIFGDNKNPQSEFRWRDMSQSVKELPDDVMEYYKECCPKMLIDHGEFWRKDSILPYFPGYSFEKGVSTYKDVETGSGGYVLGEPGMYKIVPLLDVESMHPNSAIDECIFGPRYTRRFKELVDIRLAIKHEDWETASKFENGALIPYIQLVKDGKMTSKDLANAFKTAINSVYGLTSASFANACRDPRNIDNIVAKRGALFMVELVEYVRSLGCKVVHIKTDSIKLDGGNPEIIQKIMYFAEGYGYKFAHEATYDRICLVNKAVYIAKYAPKELCERLYGYIPGDNVKKHDQWVAVGDQFARPVIFKTLFSKEKLDFSDYCETKNTESALYLDMNESLPEGEHNYIFVGKTGAFLPIRSGKGGGVLYRTQGEKYSSVEGTKGYRWLEAELLKDENYLDWIDESYYRSIVDDALDNMSKYGDPHEFIDYVSYIPEAMENKSQPQVINPVIEDDVPWNPCGDGGPASCFECPYLRQEGHQMVCKRGYDISSVVTKSVVILKS